MVPGFWGDVLTGKLPAAGATWNAAKARARQATDRAIVLVLFIMFDSPY
jgi:hypothetical protein